jgi:hypothetical protein
LLFVVLRTDPSLHKLSLFIDHPIITINHPIIHQPSSIHHHPIIAPRVRRCKPSARDASRRPRRH